MNEIFLSFFYKYGLKWRTIYAVGDKFDSDILKFTTTVRGDIFCFKQFQEQSSWEINKYYTQFSDDSIKQKKILIEKSLEIELLEFFIQLLYLMGMHVWQIEWNKYRI